MLVKYTFYSMRKCTNIVAVVISYVGLTWHCVVVMVNLLFRMQEIGHRSIELIRFIFQTFQNWTDDALIALLNQLTLAECFRGLHFVASEIERVEDMLHCVQSEWCASVYCFCLYLQPIYLFISSIFMFIYRKTSDRSPLLYQYKWIRPSACMWVPASVRGPSSIRRFTVYRVAQNKLPHQLICYISSTSGLVLKILEAA